ncbi:MAG: family N-acetyltransferase [Bacillota bacterium]|jgi:hypothetical protein|nr:family N-acetyltransferase [Bacillota bacterium]
MTDFRYDIYHYDNYKINHSIQELYRDVFRFDMKDEFHWRFLENPKGKAMAVVVTLEHELIGHSAAMPIELIIRGNKVDAVISMGTMIHSGYTGHKIGSTMLQALHQYLYGSKYSLFLGFPNDNSFSMFTNKLGWVHVKDYNFIRFLDNGLKPVNCYELTDVSSLALNLEPVSTDISLNRDPEYLTWRYKDKRYEIYKSIEDKYFVITKFQEKYDIVYWSANVKEDDVRDFAQFLYSTGKGSIVSTWNSIPFSDRDTEAGQRRYHFCIKKLKEDLTDDVLNDKEWMWLMGDSELF